VLICGTPYGLAGIPHPERTGIKVIIHTHNIEYKGSAPWKMEVAHFEMV
jgi:hypothetical protein